MTKTKHSLSTGEAIGVGIGAALLFVTVAAFMFGVTTLIVMWLWNAVMVNIISVPSLSFWQAAGLTILTRLLVTPFGSPVTNTNKKAE